MSLFSSSGSSWAMADAQALLTPATQSAADIEAQLTGYRTTAADAIHGWI